ncbi:MAG: hypothetical protein KDD34_04990 [Bdellovibrionales bacterium]|nr:hypothetical protein [Bdellovibrionales bacterium]
MTGIFGKIFGGKKKGSDVTPYDVIEETLNGVLEAGNFELSFDLDEENGEYFVELYGDDEELLKSKEGQLLDAFQLFVKRVLQHQFPEDNIHVNLDSDGFREDANEALLDLADKLKGIALDKGKSVYFRALPPKDRKIVHQYLAEDGRVKSRSVGEGHFKKIKIYPIKGKGSQVEDQPNS